MDGAVFILMVNFAVAISFGAVFVVVAQRSHSRKAAMWMGAGFIVASLSAICEILVPYVGPPRLWALSAFATVLGGMVMLTIGIGDMYRQQVNARVTAVFVSISLFLAFLIYDLPRGTPLHAFLYQIPFAVVVLAGAFIVIRTRQQTSIDRFLGLLLLATGAHFFAKAGLAVSFGSGVTASDYVHTNYALISQSITAVLMVAVGLALLAKLVLEIIAVQRTESEIDILSGLLNRRGFDRRVQDIFRNYPSGPHAVVICDLDHFKAINDTFGHHVGDVVIQAFGERIRLNAPPGSAVGRLGGEEFAIFLPKTEVDAAVQLAQGLRLSTMSLSGLPPSLTVTASFGTASVSAEHALTEAYHRADQALYKAKNSGRNRVKLAAGGFGNGN